MAKKPSVGIKTPAQANETLGIIAQLESRLSGEKALFDITIHDAKAKYECEIKEDKAKLEKLIAELAEYAEERQAEIGTSTDLPNGTIGFRKQPESIELNGTESDESLAKMKKKDIDLFERIVVAKYTVSKTALKLYIKQFGSKAMKLLSNYGIEQKEGGFKFFYKTNPKVN